eukprot:TRINITY_DN1488_c0_g1_i1.p1 TRINITY_DN1488_c0_g1~~TRINITY_DN1488_c0_g1_i1.p1  ORF type:complete len:123 (-),score=35.36 TRINITY_DN1488_c0_g1_i1:70-438(-)
MATRLFGVGWRKGGVRTGRYGTMRYNVVAKRNYATLEFYNDLLKKQDTENGVCDVLEQMKSENINPDINSYKLVKQFFEKDYELNGKRRFEEQRKEAKVTEETITKEVLADYEAKHPNTADL